MRKILTKVRAWRGCVPAATAGTAARSDVLEVKVPVPVRGERTELSGRTVHRSSATA